MVGVHNIPEKHLTVQVLVGLHNSGNVADRDSVHSSLAPLRG